MDSETDGGVEPAPEPGPPDPDPDPLYKLGGSRARLRSVLHTAILVGGAFVAANVLSLVVLQVVAITGIVPLPETVETIADLPTSATVLLFAMNFVGFFLVGWAYLRWRGETVSDTSLYDVRFPTVRDLLRTAGGLVGLFVLLAVVSNVAAQFGLRPAENVTQTLGEGNPQLFLYLIPIALLLNGPVEEFLFRGLVQGLFRDAYGVLPGVLLSAATFGVVHYFAVSGGGGDIVYTLTIITALGATLGALYEWSGNLLVPSLVHGLFNALQYAGLYVVSTGG